MDLINQQELEKLILKGQIRILLELSKRVEDGEDVLDAWIDLKTELARKLKKLEA
jgi:hypothetical protein